MDHRVLTHSLLPLRVATASKSRLNEEINPLLPTGIGERYSQTISNLGNTTLLRRCKLTGIPIKESAELIQGALKLIHYRTLRCGPRSKNGKKPKGK
jgi:hypothetical protein